MTRSPRTRSITGRRRLGWTCYVALVLPVLAAGATAQTPRPGMEWSTYLGGSNDEYADLAMRVAANGDLLVAGTTRSANFPIAPGAYQPTHGGNPSAGWGGDGVIARIRSDTTPQQVVWSTFLGGSQGDVVMGLAEDPCGVVTVCGSTNSPVFDGMTTHGGSDAFVARFVWDGTQLVKVWSVLLGTPNHEGASSLAIHPSGAIVVVGTTNSTAFPVTPGCYQQTLAGDFDMFVAVLDGDGSLQRATYLGGSGTEGFGVDAGLIGTSASVILDPAGNPVVLCHRSYSFDFPTTAGAHRTIPLGVADGLLARLDSGLRVLTYGTYLGGNQADMFNSLALGPNGFVTVVGSTNSFTYPTTDGSRRRNSCPSGTGDAVVTTLDLSAQGSQGLIWSTILGGMSCDMAVGVEVDRRGAVTVTGWTSSLDFDNPLPSGAFQPVYGGGGWDGFITRFDPPVQGVARRVYSTYLGGSGADQPTGIARDGFGNLVVTGRTNSTNFPTSPGCLQPGPRGGLDAFLTKLTMLPIGAQGVERFGAATRACLHPIWQDVDQLPSGGATLALRAHGAPPNTPAVLLIGPTLVPPAPSWRLINADIWLAPGDIVIDEPVLMTGPVGYVSRSLRLPATLPSGAVASQWLFLTTAGCPGTGVLAASEGLLLW